MPFYLRGRPLPHPKPKGLGAAGTVGQWLQLHTPLENPPRLVAVTEGRGGVATGVASLGHRCATKEVGAAGAPRGAATEVVGKDDADGMST
jgi:hypothetical protein